MPRLMKPACHRPPFIACLLAQFIFVFLAPTGLAGQATPSLVQVNKLHVQLFDEGTGSSQLRESLIKRIRKTGKFQIVETPAEADAILKGDGQIWVKGHLTMNSKTPATSRQSVYGGFLSAEIVSKKGEPLWSYLVTPSKFAWGSIVDDLANNLVKKMMLAREEKAPLGLPLGNSQTLSRTDLTGGGATFPAPLYKKWFESFEELHPGVNITYAEVGSEEGTNRLVRKELDFAASDVSTSPAESAHSGPEFRRFASALGAVVPIYNLKSLNRDLKFTPEALADIYLGKVRKWNDPEIRKSNKGIDLPDAEIVVVHRSDGSGTSYAWSDFLSKISPEWKKTLGAGTTLQWPVGQGVKSNEGVASAVQQTPNAIGYVELVYAIQHQLSYGAVRNSSGEYVRADLGSLAEAAKTTLKTVSLDSISTITNAPGRDAYPIATFTWLLLPPSIDEPAKASALRELLRWILTDGQKECSLLGYAPLPREIAAQQLQLVNEMK